MGDRRRHAGLVLRPRPQSGRQHTRRHGDPHPGDHHVAGLLRLRREWPQRRPPPPTKLAPPAQALRRIAFLFGLSTPSFGCTVTSRKAGLPPIPAFGIGWLYPVSLDSPSLREPLEKRIVLPLRARRTVRHPFEQAHHDPVELRRRCLIHRLIQIVGRLVIPVADKIVEYFVFRTAELVAELERQRRHTLATKAVLVAAARWA